MKNTLRFYFLVSFILVTTTLSAKTIYYVTQNGTGDGSSWAKAAGNIQTMIDKAASGDEVWVAKGTYNPTTEATARDPRSRTFLLKSGVNLYGGFAGNETAITQRALSDIDTNGKVDPYEFSNSSILSGDIDGVADVWSKKFYSDGVSWIWNVTGNENNCYHVVTSNVSQLTYFDGFSVKGGNANVDLNNNGGGLYFSANTFSKNCQISNCSAINNGGGIYSNLSASNCKISNCLANGSGGGIYCAGQDCEITDCSAYTSGGGIYCISSSNCVVKNCSAYTSGGGVYSTNIFRCNVINCTTMGSGGGVYNTGKGEVANCKISDCKASTGGGICFYPVKSDPPSASTYISNCQISNCFAISNGGGIYAYATFSTTYASSSYISNCTVSNCSANNIGGGIYIYFYGIYDNMVSIVNCAVANCSAVKDAGGIYVITNSKIQSCVASNNGANNFVGGTQENNSSPDIYTTFTKPTSFTGIAKTDLQKTELVSANWQLRDGSPCINSGITLSYFSNEVLDVLGNPRVLNGKIDIGAYEYMMPIIKLPVIENFNEWNDFNNSLVLYGASNLNVPGMKWAVENKKAIFSYKTAVTQYSCPIFTYQIDALKASKVILRYDMFFEAYSGSISQLGTEKLTVEYSTDLISWKALATYSNQNGTIPNRTYTHDISSLVAGKTFFIRFNANGVDSKRIEKWEIDNIIVDTNGMTTDVRQIKDAAFFYTIQDGQLNIQNLVEDTSIQLFDMTGKLLNNRKVNNNSISFTLPVHGIYIVRTESKTGIESKKVVW